MAVRSYGQDTDFRYVWHCDLDLEDTRMTLVQGYDTSFDHGQQSEHLCEILSRSIMAERCYGLDTDFRHV